MKNYYNWFRSLSKIPVRVNTLRPYIVPTGLGFSYGVLVFILVVVSVNNRNNLIFLFAFFLFSVGLVTMLMTHKNFEKIKLAFLQSSLLFKNEAGILTYKIENSRAKESFMIEVADKTIESIKPLEKRDLQLSFLPQSYGVMQVPMQKLESRFPLQFLRVWRYMQPEVRITVFPEKINYFGQDSQQKDIESGIQKLHLQESLEKEISHFDRFQVTDPTQHINWKILAKTGELYSNKYESLAADKLQVILRWKDTEPLVELEKRKSQFTYWMDHFYKLKVPFAVIFEEQQVDVQPHDYKNLVKALRFML